MKRFLEKRVLMTNYEELKVRAIKLSSSYNYTKRVLSEQTSQLERLCNDRQVLEEKINIQRQSVEVFKYIVDKMSRDHIEKLQDLVSFGMQTIFFDRNYSLEIEIDDRRDVRVAEFYLIETFSDGTKLKTSFQDSIGGGILAIVGFIMQVYYIRYFGMAPVIFCDESFSQVSDQYIDGLKEFMRKLSLNKKFIFVLVSHDSRLISMADKAYLVQGGKVSEIEVDK